MVAIDARRTDGGHEVYSHGGRRPTGRTAVDWAREAAERGAGEILLTSMDQDGTKDGYDLALTAVGGRRRSDVPVIASGGAGNPEHLRSVLTEAGAARRARRVHLPLRRASGTGDQAVSPRPWRGGAPVSDGVQPRFGDDGLITAVVQDDETAEVLMVAHMNREAWDATLRNASSHLFQPIATAVVGEGRDEREHHASASGSH